MEEDFLLPEVDRSTLQYKVTNKLREVILKGQFQMGDRLVQDEWASKLGVSRMPIREALQQLEAEGLVRLEPRKGAIVTPVSSKDIEEIYHLRSLLEGEALVQAIPHMDEEAIEELEDLHQKMRALSNKEEDHEEYTLLNKEFHEILRQRCPWRRIHSMIDLLWKGISPYTPSLLGSHREEALEEHGLIIKFIQEDKHEDARIILEKHILRTKDNLLSVIKENENKGITD